MACAAAAAALALHACSSRPREFTPQLAVAPADAIGFEEAYATCRQLLAQGKLDPEGRLASGGAGAAAGAGTFLAGGAAASAVGGYGGLAVASATVVALPFVAVAGAWGLAKKKKNRKERMIQTATAGCLGQRGYAVAGWTPAKKARASAAAASGAAR
jgi:hypothetical protein